jgi:hypothetical protein
MKKIAILTVFLALAGPAFTAPPAGAAERELRVPETLAPGLDHLLSLVGSGSGAAIDTRLAGQVIDYVRSRKAPDALYNMGKRDGATSAYYEFEIEKSLEQVIRLTYSPNLPSYITYPSSIRLSYWNKVEGRHQPFPEIWKRLKDLSDPVIVRATEYTENTPDQYTGVYYAYNLDRTLILLKHRGRNVLISLSRQIGPSQVGKKGVVIEPDEAWNYLYSEEKGLPKPGLGWVDSYMYDSYSVMVYVETDGLSPAVKCGIFKWLRAGWAGINMVRPVHIHRGMARFADTFKSILESPRLPSPDRLSEIFRQIASLSESELKKRCGEYFSHLANRYGENNPHYRKWFRLILEDESYLDRMTREHLQSIVCLEYLKYLLGRDDALDISLSIRPAEQKKSG